MNVIRFIFHNLDSHRRSFWLVAASAALLGAIDFCIPLLLAGFVDGPINSSTTPKTIIGLVALYSLSLILAYVVRGRGEALATVFANHVRLKYYAQLCQQSLSNLNTKHSGYLQSLVNKVSDGLTDILYSMFWSMIPGLFLVVLFSIFIARQSIVIATINLVLIAVFLIVSTALAKKMVPLMGENNRRRASLLGGYADFTANIGTVIQLGAQSYTSKTLDVRAKSNNEQIIKLQSFHARRWFLLHTLFGITYLSTIGYLLWQISSGHASVGLLILFVSAYGMLRGLIERLSENIKSFMEMNTYISEIESSFSDQQHYGHHNPDDWEAISLHDIEFQHPGGAHRIIIPDFVVHAGEKVCIEGSSGQGKSTLLGIVCNALPVDGGVRMVDEINFDQAKAEFFRLNITTISQSGELFHMSVRDNLTLGEAIDDQILLVGIRDCGLEEWYTKLDKGLDTIIGEKGSSVSSGQKQRLSLLRGVLQDRTLYLLDEPTSNLDSQTEKVIIDFLQKYLRDKAVIIVTHRPEVKKMCHTSYEMHDFKLSLKGAV